MGPQANRPADGFGGLRPPAPAEPGRPAARVPRLAAGGGEAKKKPAAGRYSGNTVSTMRGHSGGEYRQRRSTPSVRKYCTGCGE